jgi:hypothetical protein
MGTGYAAVRGLMWALPSEGYDDLFGSPMAAAGGAAMVAGLVALVGLGEGRTLVIPPIVVGAIFVAAGLGTEQLDLDAAVVLTSTLVFVVIVGSVFPWLALGATGTNVDQLFSVADITADPDDIDPSRSAPTRGPRTRSSSGSPPPSGCCSCSSRRWPSRSA